MQLSSVDIERALQHARYARERGSRLPSVRETTGLVAYHAGEWAEAARDLRAARRMNGDDSQLPVLADCERALGNPDRALALLRTPAIAKLDPAVRAEAAIVEAGARRDLGENDRALRVLESFGLQSGHDPEVLVRLWYAYADALEHAGRRADAKDWFERVQALDEEQATDATERIGQLSQ